MLRRQFKNAHLSGKSAGARLTDLENEQRMNASRPNVGVSRITDVERILIAMRGEPAKRFPLLFSLTSQPQRAKVAYIGDTYVKRQQQWSGSNEPTGGFPNSKRGCA